MYVRRGTLDALAASGPLRWEANRSLSKTLRMLACGRFIIYHSSRRVSLAASDCNVSIVIGSSTKKVFKEVCEHLKNGTNEVVYNSLESLIF